MVLLAQTPKKQRVPKAAVTVMISRPCQGRLAGQEGMSHLELGDRVEVSEDEARQLVVWAGSAFYVDAEDDETPNKANTLTSAREAPIKCEMELRAARKKQRDEEERIARAQHQELLAKYGSLI